MTSKVRLFTDSARTDTSPSTFSESKYHYLDRSGRPAFSRIRDVTSRWFECYPEVHREDWKARFCSDDNLSHLSAFFELYCHEFCRAHGFNVEVHPSRLPVSSTSPDFKLSRDGHDCCYFEATVVFEDKVDVARDRILDPIYDAINRLDIRNWFVNVSARRNSHTAPSTNKILKEIKSYCDEHDPNEAVSLGSLPKFEYRDKGWYLEFELIPRKKEARDVGRRSLGITGSATGAKWCNGYGQIINKLSKKAKRYRDLEFPLIVAVACNDPLIDSEDFIEALIGDGISIEGISSKTHSPSNKRFGIWEGPGGPQNQRLSAVLQVDSVMPWTIGVARATLWHCPSPTKSVPLDWWRIPQFGLGPGTKTTLLVVGEPASEILQVPPNLLDE